jgi:hypothetical protein
MWQDGIVLTVDYQRLSILFLDQIKKLNKRLNVLEKSN